MANASLDHNGFVLFSMPRTGSNMMVSLLKTHPQIACLSAIFSRTGWTDWSKADPEDARLHRLATLPVKWNDRKERIACMPDLLQSLLVLHNDKRAFGFKQHFGGVNDTATRRVIEQNWPAVILHRENILAAYSSNKLVEKTGEGSVFVGQTPTRATVPFEADEFEVFLERRNRCSDHWTAEIAASGVPSMTIEYGDARAPGGLKPVSDFLGLDADGFGDPVTAKRHSDDILSRFSNPGDAAAWLESNGRSEWSVED